MCNPTAATCSAVDAVCLSMLVFVRVCAITQVPTLERALLGAAHHLFMNELRRAPKTVLDGIITLAKQAVTLDTGSFTSSTVIAFGVQPATLASGAL